VRVLITGGAGFVGSHIADRLVAGRHEPLLLDALLPQAHGDGPPPGADCYELVRGDVRDADLLARLLPRVDAVCHQAAMVGHGVDPADAPGYAAHNDLGTAVLLAAMHAAGRFEPRCPRCGRDLVPGLVTEDAPFDPRSTYAATKAAQEYLVGAWARQTGGAAWSLRYHNVYGPRMPRDTPVRRRRVDLPVGAGTGRGTAGSGGRVPAPRLRARHRRRRGHLAATLGMHAIDGYRGRRSFVQFAASAHGPAVVTAVGCGP